MKSTKTILKKCIPAGKKNIYHSYIEAENMALLISNEIDEKIKPYLCQYCKNFHIGHTTNTNNSGSDL